MELSPFLFRSIPEEDLRTHFLIQLNGWYEGQATGETFNLSGKTDIIIRDRDRNVFIAECKFWRGSKSLSEAIDQLLGYTSWRDTKTAIVLFNKRSEVPPAAAGLANPARSEWPPYLAASSPARSHIRCTTLATL